eukprot:TRINITY_DN7743_c0_g1_i1.p1 TRINITY_DN7743_c0_g1~~TRINITY_DN7743_c0_g1_i1.p1  ORF type:complete len:128 (+),score=5.81 TRINITY_DN7743_c0_g1_i1:27-386(+)
MIQKARGLLEILMLRRTKEEVTPDLPSKTEIPVYLPLNKIQNKWYRRLLRKDSIIDQLLNYKQVMHMIIQLRKVCNHPSMLTYKTAASRAAERAENYRKQKTQQDQGGDLIFKKEKVTD